MYNRYDCAESYNANLRRDIKHEYDCDSHAYEACYRGQPHISQSSGSILKLLQDQNSDIYTG